VVVGADRYLAEDAAALVELQMESLAPIVGIDAAATASTITVTLGCRSSAVVSSPNMIRPAATVC